MKHVVNLPLQARQENAQAEALELLHQDAEHLAHRLALRDDDLAEVLYELAAWYDDRPLHCNRFDKSGKGVRA